MGLLTVMSRVPELFKRNRGLYQDVVPAVTQ